MSRRGVKRSTGQSGLVAREDLGWRVSRCEGIRRHLHWDIRGVVLIAGQVLQAVAVRLMHALVTKPYGRRRCINFAGRACREHAMSHMLTLGAGGRRASKRVRTAARVKTVSSYSPKHSRRVSLPNRESTVFCDARTPNIQDSVPVRVGGDR